MDEQRLERLLEVGRSIVSELDLDTLLEHILEVARELTGARYAAVGVLDDRRARLARFITSGIDAISVTPDAVDRTRRLVAAAEQRLLLEAARA